MCRLTSAGLAMGSGGARCAAAGEEGSSPRLESVLRYGVGPLGGLRWLAAEASMLSIVSVGRALPGPFADQGIGSPTAGGGMTANPRDSWPEPSAAAIAAVTEGSCEHSWLM